MGRFARIALRVLVVLLAIGFVGYRYLLGRTAVPETTPYVLDMDELRRLATSLPGERPVRVNHEQVAIGSLPRGAIFAGESIRTPEPMIHGAYQVVYADGYVVIDSAFDEPGMQAMGNPDAKFSAEGYTTVQRALAGARKIVITHEHADHSGGFASYASPENLVGRLELTREQLANTEQLDRARFPKSLAGALTPIEYERAYALAPGVVLVKAAGHTPGSQMVFVQLADGKEYLFLGDVAWHMAQIRELWYRPRLVTDFFLGEDRDAVMAQFRALHDLASREPVQIVASHDIDQRKSLVESGALGAKFEF
jgi:glyoxylase-like metal-dependent hydrolase (beta-lactamase superfamily II)